MSPVPASTANLLCLCLLALQIVCVFCCCRPFCSFLPQWAAGNLLAPVIQPARLMLHAGRSIARQSASKRHWRRKHLRWLWLLVLLRVWLLLVLLLLLLRPFLWVLAVSPNSPSPQSPPNLPHRPLPRPAAATNMGAPAASPGAACREQARPEPHRPTAEPRAAAGMPLGSGEVLAACAARSRYPGLSRYPPPPSWKVSPVGGDAWLLDCDDLFPAASITGL